MANYSKEELQYIASQVQPYLLELVKASGLDVDSIEVVEDTDGITSLPAYDNRGGVKKIVRVPISTFSKPAQDVADSLAESLALVQEAVTKADEAVTKAEAAVDGIEDIRNDIEKVEEIKASESAREEAEQLRQTAEAARVTEFDVLKQNMDAATDSALDTANHPTYVGTDNYVYVWDKENKTYKKTDIYVKGDKGEQGQKGEQGPKGENGTGSGNVLVATDNLQKGKTYLFTPDQNESAEGTFVEYEVPQIDLSEVATKADLASKQDKITDLDAIRTGANKGSTAYQKPTSGVPKTDLSSDVQSSLNKAETALQEHQDITGKQDKLVSGENIKTINGQSILGEGDIQIQGGGGSEVPIVDHGTGDTTFVLTPNILHKWGTVTSLTLTLAVSTDTTVANYYMAQFTCGSSATSLNLPDTIKWITEPDIEANKTYQISILDNLGVIGGA